MKQSNEPETHSTAFVYFTVSLTEEPKTWNGRRIKGQGNPKDGTQQNNCLGLPPYATDGLFLTVLLTVENITIPLLFSIKRFMKKQKKQKHCIS